MSKYLEDVQRYDADADPAVVEKIVKHLSIALQSRDASLVACSDKSERERVRDKWCMGKLGESDASTADAVVASVCQAMKDDRNKNRVTFYYLVAREMGKLGAL